MVDVNADLFLAEFLVLHCGEPLDSENPLNGLPQKKSLNFTFSSFENPHNDLVLQMM